MIVKPLHDWVAGKGFYENYQFAQWRDGNQIWAFAETPRDRTIERLISADEPEVARKQWHIVAREGYGNSKYPPIIAGPFENIKVALVAFNLLYNQGERP